jgi:(p)ppGpp synthase/HD superfamily hydrolase
MTHPSIDATIALAVRLHSGQRDKANVPYIAHPLAVMRMVPEEAWHVAVLHDVLEDCADQITRQELNAAGYDAEEIAALDLLTRLPFPPYEYAQYIQRIANSGNRLAILVKRADLIDNLDRLPDGDSLDKRYRRALSMLPEVE